MVKLFAIEDNLDSNNNLLIDKVLSYSEKKTTPISVTAEIIKQRQELKKDIESKLNTENDEDTSSTDTVDNSNDTDSNYTDNESKSDSDNEDTSQQKDTDNNKPDTENKKDKDDSDIAEDKDSLKSIIGSGLSNKTENSSKEEKNANKKEDTSVAKESYKLTPNNIFKPLANRYSKYLISLEEYNIKDKPSISEQPVVYVKDSVIESLNNLISIANIYISKSKQQIDDNAQTIKNINERLTALRQFIENRKYHFTNKLINDSDLLSNLSIKDKSNLRETSKVLVRYIDDSNKLVNFILNNKLEDMSSGLINSKFIVEEGAYSYKYMLPGFNLVKSHLDSYTNYLKTKLDEFHYYKLRVFKTEDLYNLEAISITEDKDLDYIINNLDEMLINISLTIDNFNVVNVNLNKLIDEVKVVIYDIENDKYTKLANINIDTNLKDFIKFKLILEIYNINITLLLDYILNSMSVIDKCIELKM